MNHDDPSLEELLRTAALAGATDILLSPAPHVGKLIVRSAGETLLSRVVDPGLLRSLSMQLGMKTGQPALLGGGSSTLDASLASFEVIVRHVPMRVRVICTPTPSGPMVRLRLQSHALLLEALEQFRTGRFGGLEVLALLIAPRGVIFVVGPTSSGKTSALHHLTASLCRPLTIVSEAQEFVAADARVLAPGDLHGEALERLVTDAIEAESRVRGGDDAAAVILDEIDESDKLSLALTLGRAHLVLATLTAPNLENALRRVRAASEDLDGLIGVLRVEWMDGGERTLRRPSYGWFPVEGHPGENPIPRALLDRMDDLASYRALERLEQSAEPLGAKRS